MTQHATELCHLLVDDMYGDVTSGVFGALQDRGRLALHSISHHTAFSPRQVKHSLAVLIQQNLAFWYVPQDESTVYYEANLVNAYAIVQLGKHISLVERRLGKVPASLASALFLAGHTRVEDLKQAHNDSHEDAAAQKIQKAIYKSNGHPVRGILKTDDLSDDADSESLASALDKAIEARYFTILHESHLRSGADNRREAEQLVKTRSSIDGPLKGHDKLEFETSVRRLLEEWESGTEERIKILEEKYMTSAAIRNRKRGPEPDGGETNAERLVANKKQRFEKSTKALPQTDNGREPLLEYTNGNGQNEDISVKKGKRNESHASMSLKEPSKLTRGLQTTTTDDRDAVDHDRDAVDHVLPHKHRAEDAIILETEGNPNNEENFEGQLGHTTHFVGDGKKRGAPDETDDWQKNERMKKRHRNNSDSQTGEQLGSGEGRAKAKIQPVLRVNLDRLTVAARNESLALTVERAIGVATSAVYSRLLRRVEKDITSCRISREKEDSIEDDDYEPEANPRVYNRDILEELKDVQNLGEGIAEVEPTKIDLSDFLSRKRKDGEEDESSESEVEEVEEFAGSGGQAVAHEVREAEDEGREDNRNQERLPNGDYYGKQEPNEEDSQSVKVDTAAQTHYLSRTRLEQTRQHLFLLAEHDPPFLTYHRRKSHRPEFWSVPYPTLLPALRLSALFSTIASRCGKPAHRLARILHEKGKLDEKTLTALSLLNQKAMRSALADMHAAGFLELQEIPRDNNRQPSRTLFLWFFDPKRCALQALDNAYKAMARLLQRLKVEREAVKGVLGKAERSDVEGREAEFLTAGEMATLGKWKEVEARIWGELARLDDFVCLLRDY